MATSVAMSYALKASIRSGALDHDAQATPASAAATQENASTPTAGAYPATPVYLPGQDIDMPDAPPIAEAFSSSGQSVPGVTVYGPRHVEGGDERVTVVLDRNDADRLIVVFQNVDLKGKGKAREQSGPAQQQQQQLIVEGKDNGENDDEDDDDEDDEGAQLPASKAKAKGKKKSKNNNKKGKGRK